MKNLSWYIFALITGLQIFDILSTYAVLDKGGVEKNPVVKALMAAMGVIPALILLKTVMLALIAVVIIYYPSEYLKFVLLAVAAGYSFVCWHNYRNL